jgi:hypothetical protein
LLKFGWKENATNELLGNLREGEKLEPKPKSARSLGDKELPDGAVLWTGPSGGRYFYFPADENGDEGKGDSKGKPKVDKPPTKEERKAERAKKDKENADTREKPDTSKFTKEEMKMLKELSGEPLRLKSIKEAHKRIVADRAKGIAGMGGPVASEGESKFTEANNEMKKGKDGISEHDRFKHKNKNQIEDKKKKFKNKKKLLVGQEDTLEQLGFEKDENGKYPDEAYDYLATREAWAESKLAEVKADKKSVYYGKFGGNKKPKPEKPGKKQDSWDKKEKNARKAYMDWMNAGYDGAISTQAHLEGSRLDTSKDHIVTQATPEGDKVIESALQSKYDEHKAKCGSGTKESCKKADHYARELAKWDKFKGFHDTYAIGVDKDGNMIYIAISNKKGSHMKDPQNNTTPAQRIAFIKKQFGPEISQVVADVMDKGMDDVSRARETTIIDTTNLEITDGIVEEFESERFTKYRNDLDDQATGRSKPTTNNPEGKKRPFGQWLDSQKPPVVWEDLTSKQKLEYAQKFAKEKLYYTDKDGNQQSRVKYNEDGSIMYRNDDGEWIGPKDSLGRSPINLRYDTFGKLGIKFGEFGASEEAIALKEKESAVVKKVHREVTETLFKEDEPDGYNPDTKPEADNGKNVQGYISGVLSAVHADTYIDMEDDEDYDVLVQMGVNGVRPSHIRECLAEKSGFKGDINTDGGRAALKKHLRKRCRIKSGEDRVSVMDSDGNEQELFNDQWRTAGAGQQKVATHFGQGMIDCMTEKVKKK